MPEKVPGEWVLKKLLGPVFDKIGPDLADLYVVGRDKIVEVAKRKIPDLKTDNKVANLRVARDVFWNGSFSDSEVSAEYFGGILASSRSSDGKDDSMIFYLDMIKSLSSTQLKLHYMIYRALNELFVGDKSVKDSILTSGTKLSKLKLYCHGVQLNNVGVDFDKAFFALSSRDLIGAGSRVSPVKIDDNKTVLKAIFQPTTLGIQLYAVACNKNDIWRNFTCDLFDVFPSVEKLSFRSLQESDFDDDVARMQDFAQPPR